MNISAPKVRKDGESVIVSAEFHASEHKDVLWFKLDAKYQDYVVTERGDAFLIGLLLYAMARGEDIHIDCPISEKLYYNLSNYLIPAISLANPKLRPVKVIPTRRENTSINTGKAVGTGFSGGVDSFSTIYSHLVNPQCPSSYRITHLTFFNIGSHGDFGGETAQVLFNERLAILKGYPLECGLDYVVIDSNISDILQRNFEETHTIRSMAPVLLLQRLFQTYYYSSTFRMDEFKLTTFDMSLYDILITAMLSTESVDIYSTGCQFTRVEKTAMIAEYEPTWRYLNVCVCRNGNCSTCFKCMRTLLTLDILGKLKNYDKVFNLSEYRRCKNRYIAQVIAYRTSYFYKDIYNEMRRKGIHVPIESRLLACKHLCGSALRRMAKNVRRSS